MTGTLVLDLDGTLVDSVADLSAALSRMMAARGLPGFTDVETTKMIGNGVPALVASAFAARLRPQDAAALPGYIADYAAHATDATRPFPGVPETLKTLSDAGWRLAVCTNKPEAEARIVLAALALEHYFAAIGGGDSFPVRKPDPGHLVATIAAAGGDPTRAVMAGDHANDVAAARGAGIPCIFAAWGYGPPEMADGAAAIAQEFSDLPALATRLLGRDRFKSAPALAPTGPPTTV